jgi:S-formylglutathione hydrolase FrmB
MVLYLHCLSFLLSFWLLPPAVHPNKSIPGLTILEPVKQKCKGNILFLNGWNMKTEEVCRQSALCSLALENGYRLLFPEMGKSVYASAYFRETRADYGKHKSIQWLSDTLLPQLKSQNIYFEKGGNNHIMALSTGARGAVLLASRLPDYFRSLILLSGDYNQCIDTSDWLMINTYGRFYQHPERWKTIDNPLHASSSLRCNVFIAHGLKDKMVKAEHSYLLEKKLKQNEAMKSYSIQSWYPDSAGHDWSFWRKGIEKGIDFIEN